jgi:hypothetical protein
MKELRAELEADDSLAETWTIALVAAITKGIEVSVEEFPEDDPDLVLAYNVQAHDEDSNKYKPTSLKDLVAVAKRYKARTPGGDWAKVSKALEALYGSRKRSSTAQLSQSLLFARRRAACRRAVRARCARVARTARARAGMAGGPCARAARR